MPPQLFQSLGIQNQCNRIILPEAVFVDPGPLSAGPGISPRVAVVPPESSHSCPLSEYTPPQHCSRTSQGQTVY